MYTSEVEDAQATLVAEHKDAVELAASQLQESESRGNEALDAVLSEAASEKAAAVVVIEKAVDDA